MYFQFRDICIKAVTGTGDRHTRKSCLDTNSPQNIVFRSNHASNALALAGNLPRDREKLLFQLRKAMEGACLLRSQFMRGL